MTLWDFARINRAYDRINPETFGASMGDLLDEGKPPAVIATVYDALYAMALSNLSDKGKGAGWAATVIASEATAEAWVAMTVGLSDMRTMDLG